MTLNVKSIRIRLRKLDQYIGELEKHQHQTLDEFTDDYTAQLATERALQAAVETCTDIASHIVTTYALGKPESQRDMFSLLADAGYLDSEYAATMCDMVSLRNRLVHLYWDVNVARLHGYLQTDLAYLTRFRDFVLGLLAIEDELRAEDGKD